MVALALLAPKDNTLHLHNHLLARPALLIHLALLGHPAVSLSALLVLTCLGVPGV